ncbi:MAG TPA: HAD-IA family hydrolase [Bryobacteraceae bacterium]|nr:HAD-IA family hydrolase [Bryobacteraceae bacterium]
MTKPGPEIYQHCLRGLGAAPSDTLFLDDRPENVHAAEALGIHSILFTTPAELAGHLDRRFATPAPLIATVK